MTDTDRLRGSLETIIREMLPELLALHFWEYRVLSSQDGPPVLITAQATDARVPAVVDIKLRPGADGGYATPIVGASILVGFANGDYAKPFVYALDPDTAATQVWLGDGQGRVLRSGDLVAITGVNPGTGVTSVTISLAATIVTPGPPGTGFSKVKA